MTLPIWRDSAYLVVYLIIMVQASLQLDIGKNSAAVHQLIKLQFCLFQKTAMQSLVWQLKLAVVLRS